MHAPVKQPTPRERQIRILKVWIVWLKNARTQLQLSAKNVLQVLWELWKVYCRSHTNRIAIKVDYCHQLNV
jgi:hypothetical protein